MTDPIPKLPRHKRPERLAYQREWAKKRRKSGIRPNYRSQRNYNLKRLYGITLDDYDRMLELQGGACAICRRFPGKRALAVDHNHRTGEVRGLLCYMCNYAMGVWKEDAERFLRVYKYLKGELPFGTTSEAGSITVTAATKTIDHQEPQKPWENPLSGPLRTP